jgi:thiamine pyrophosphokinase
VPDENQDLHDLDKSILFLFTKLQETRVSIDDVSVVVLGSFGGRFDQEVANIHTLFKWKGVFAKLVFVDKHGCTFLLESSIRNIIVPLRSDVYEGRYCGLLPLNGKVNSIRTSGLAWNLNDEPLELGVKISSSNQVLDNVEEVTIECSEPVIWTCTWEAIVKKS